MRIVKRKNSGQLLIVAALAIAILISSTTAYVYEVSKGERNSQKQCSLNNYILAIKQTTRNTMISSLKNISNGGENTVLFNNLNTITEVLRNTYQFGTCNQNFTLLNNSNYNSGVWLSWNSNPGVSSTYANFTLKIYGVNLNAEVNYQVNVTTNLLAEGFYTPLENQEKFVNITCELYNEGEHALAKNITVYYENLGSWILVNNSNNLSIINYDNGTYSISFQANVSSSTVPVSLHVYDLREIFVQANITCNAS
ncbi:hypothetical protein J7L49_03330 [Candidatus Bathyarchaeota archaeon]|nr:hypothetical protein [Candidatus Bathyarchaeota archaeon]